MLSAHCVPFALRLKLHVSAREEKAPPRKFCPSYGASPNSWASPTLESREARLRAVFRTYHENYAINRTHIKHNP
ncbi:hypothetical protein Ga0080574_TMP1085 [Salipiger abyssi]|uniref:Uncharacterized protein n=1 Tax=Salipiger abyssi TaxID=1250539 RepID=A0A1P8UPU6_9RHOB|nr:hypothetical protein Ga0080574_TMP1085 [Salipiger abyssi]